MTGTGRDDTAGVAVRPPLLYLGALVAGIVLELLMPLGAGVLRSSVVQSLGGTVAVVAGAGLTSLAMHGFKAAGTNVPTVLPTTALVTTGVYARSRNPIYVGLTMIYLGVALTFNAWWALVLLAPVLVVMQVGVIRREERYLEARFGDAYRAYCARVRRWI